jgi:hypothetical protein
LGSKNSVFRIVRIALTKMSMRRNNRRNGPIRSPRKQAANLRQLATKETKLHPPQLNDYNITHSRTLRFTSVAAALNTSISSMNLLDCVLIADTATTGFQLFDVVKIKRVSVWGQAALATPSTVSVYFESQNSGDEIIHTDTSLGIQPAYVCAVPSPKSLASFYSNSGNGAFVNITCPAGSIIDVHCNFRTSNIPPTPVLSPLVGATPGELYYRGLDALPIATTNFPPPVGISVQ